MPPFIAGVVTTVAGMFTILIIAAVWVYFKKRANAAKAAAPLKIRPEEKVWGEKHQIPVGEKLFTIHLDHDVKPGSVMLNLAGRDPFTDDGFGNLRAQDGSTGIIVYLTGEVRIQLAKASKAKHIQASYIHHDE